MRSVLIVLNTFAKRKCLNHAVPEWRQDPGWVDLLLIMDMHSAVVWRQDSGCFGSSVSQHAVCGVVRKADHWCLRWRYGVAQRKHIARSAS